MTVGAVVVDYNVGPALVDAVRSLLDEKIGEVIVVENGDAGSTASALGALAEKVTIVHPGENLGFGAGVNRGVAALSSNVDLVVVANPDSVAHEGSVAKLVRSIGDHPTWAVVGPTIKTSDGGIYPSVRQFPSPLDAAGHALLGAIAPENRFTKRYRFASPKSDGDVDWVSGAFFLVRRSAFEDIGGFDEAYFMFAEDMDFCWRAHQRGFGVGTAPEAIVSHIEGVARRAHPYAMVVAHHRSAFRFASKSQTGFSKLLLPLAAVVLCLRFVAAMAQTAVSRRA